MARPKPGWRRGLHRLTRHFRMADAVRDPRRAGEPAKTGAKTIECPDICKRIAGVQDNAIAEAL